MEGDGNICQTASNHKEALYKVDLNEYDVLILDINLIISSIITSANISLEDKLEVLYLAVDDYLTISLRLAKLISRIKAVLRCGKFELI